MPSIASVLIRAWTNALSAVVVPLVVSRLYLAVAAREEDQAALGRIGLVTIAVFVGLLSFASIVTLAVAPLIMHLPLVRDLALAPLPGVAAAAKEAAASGAGAWVDGFVTRNLFAAANDGAILPLMLFAVAFGMASYRLNTESRHAVELLFRAVSEGTLVLVDWLLVPIPLVLFAFGVQAGSTSGLALGSVMIAYIVIEIVLMVLCTVLLYPIAVLAGPYAPLRLVRAAIPPQLTAAASRSSLATLPALTRAADLLRIPDTVAAFVIPLAGSSLKLSRAVSNPLKLIFLSYLLGITLSPTTIVVFAISIILLSPGTPGIPSVNISTKSLPAFAAAGIPPPYVLLLGLATGFTDVFQTILNTTSYLSATVVTARMSHSRTRVPTNPGEEVQAV